MEIILINSALIASVLIGGIFVSILGKSENEQIIKLMLAFSGGFLLSIAFIHFIPELYENGDFNVGIYILIGFLIQLVLELNLLCLLFCWLCVSLIMRCLSGVCVYVKALSNR